MLEVQNKVYGQKKKKESADYMNMLHKFHELIEDSWLLKTVQRSAFSNLDLLCRQGLLIFKEVRYLILK